MLVVVLLLLLAVVLAVLLAVLLGEWEPGRGSGRGTCCVAGGCSLAVKTSETD